jgi:hypothetical protein
MACDVDLDQVLEADVASEAGRGCLAALRRQLGGMDGAAEQQALRMLILRAARIAESRKSSALADDLIRIATTDARWLVTPGSLEASGPLDVPIRVIVQDGPPVDAFIEAQLALLSFATGPDLETKYRFTALRHGKDALTVTLAPTTWTSSVKFHAALQRDPAWASKLPDGRWIMPVPFGGQLLPGIAVVHAIVMTSDGQVIAARRNAKMRYAPEHWSVSFEEQLNEKDFGRSQDPFTAAAQRGFHEEFGAEVTTGEVVPLATLMEVGLVNLGVVMLVLPALTASEIRDSWRSGAKDSWEADQVCGLPVDDLARGIAHLGQRIHPSSELRCLALRRWLHAR